MRVAFFISGGGTTMQAVIAAGGIQKASALGVKTVVVSQAALLEFAKNFAIKLFPNG